MKSPIPLAKNLHVILDSSDCLSEEYELKEPEVREEMREELVQEILALIQTVCESVIKNDEPNEKECFRLEDSKTKEVLSVDYKEDKEAVLRNSLRAFQRQTLKDIISGKIKV